MLNTLLLDLDGTLLDTAPDFVTTLNQQLKAHGRPPLAPELIRQRVSHGSGALISVGFGINDTHPEFESLRQELISLYQTHLGEKTVIFPGMQDVLTYIGNQGWRWGIVTNKPSWLATPLLSQFSFKPACDCTVSSDASLVRKPAPDMLLYACELLGCKPKECIFIGDAEKDIIAGQRAGMLTIAALFGYVASDDAPEKWAADYYVDQAADIIPILAHLIRDNTSTSKGFV